MAADFELGLTDEELDGPPAESNGQKKKKSKGPQREDAA
jgi:hypothetical protein